MLTKKPIKGFAYEKKTTTLVRFERQGVEFPDTGIVVPLNWQCTQEKARKEKKIGERWGWGGDGWCLMCMVCLDESQAPYDC